MVKPLYEHCPEGHQGVKGEGFEVDRGVKLKAQNP
jgi:hypothetical protein